MVLRHEWVLLRRYWPGGNVGQLRTRTAMNAVTEPFVWGVGPNCSIWGWPGSTNKCRVETLPVARSVNCTYRSTFRYSLDACNVQQVFYLRAASVMMHLHCLVTLVICSRHALWADSLAMPTLCCRATSAVIQFLQSQTDEFFQFWQLNTISIPAWHQEQHRKAKDCLALSTQAVFLLCRLRCDLSSHGCNHNSLLICVLVHHWGQVQHQ